MTALGAYDWESEEAFHSDVFVGSMADWILGTSSSLRSPRYAASLFIFAHAPPLSVSVCGYTAVLGLRIFEPLIIAKRIHFSLIFGAQDLSKVYAIVEF
jgi:hypothetical protein